jgi:signal transduction histidine kinase
MKTVFKKFAGDLRVRVGYGTAFILLLAAYLLTLYANSELLREARVVGYSNRPITQGEIFAMTGRYHTLNNVIFISVGLTVLMAIFAFLTYSNENKARRIADRRVAGYQQQLQDRIEELDKVNKELIQMRSVEKLAASGRIARSIAHEVRNPLTNINLAVEQLQVDLQGYAEKSGDLLGMIGRNSDRINLLITDLLNSTKFTDLRYQRIGLHQLLDEMLEQAKDRIGLNNISVIKTYTEEPCEISVDVKRMKIALLNIVVNALEAMEAGKGVLEIRTATGNHKCMVYIKDNGSGIDEDSLSNVFEPYFTSKPNGTGLGLTNTQNIVLNHNGIISLESAKGAGTTFMIQLERA